MLTRFVLLLAFGFFSAIPARSAEYLPKAEPVAENVYVIVGPLEQRSPDNDGLNANYGFLVSPDGVVLIDSGASLLGARKIETAIRAVTDRPVRWVINTGSQDHRWLGNDYFAQRGAQIIALQRTANTQQQYARQQLESLQRFLGNRLEGTIPLSTAKPAAEEGTLEIGGESLILRYTDAHFPGDAMVYLPKHGVIFAGDLVYVDRLLAVLPWSSVKNGRQAFRAMATLKPAKVVPGHGRVCDLTQAQRESGDYYDFLAETIGTAAREMEPMAEVINRHADLPAFRHLENYDSLHRTNMNRAFTEFEGQ